MRDHLQKKHPTEYSDCEEKKKVRELKGKESTRRAKDQPSLAETQQCVKLWDINDPKAECIHIKIAKMMALDYRSLSVVSDVGFTRLLHTHTH